MFRFTDAQRRDRLAVRHGIHPSHRYPDPVAATRAITVLHATEPPTVHLALQARVDGLDVGMVDHLLSVERSVVKQLAMRRTLFGFPRDLLPAALGSASARVAASELRRLAADVERAGVSRDGVAWVEDAAAAVLARLGTDGALGATALRAEVPVLDARITFGSGKWMREAPVAPRILTLLGARGQLFRGQNASHWRVSRPVWTTAQAWLGAAPVPLSPAEGYAELVARWLWAFGPGTETDIVWWLGATKAAVRRALGDLGAVQVVLDDGQTGWVLPGDEEPGPTPAPWAALLPVLDPTTMGWKQRDFYLEPGDAPHLFDAAGNAGTTAWWNGRIVGCWVQEPDARVRVVLRVDPGSEGRRALAVEAERLTAFFAGEIVASLYTSRQMREAQT